MLKSLMTSWGEMELPRETTVRCLVVENDDTTRSQSLVEGMSPLPNGIEIDYVLETEPGIPFGRNRAAREALAQGADLLAFVDDDEMVAADWLVEMAIGYRGGTARLLGGPLRVAPASADLSWLERIMHESMVEHFRKREVKRDKRSTLNETPRVTVYTNNWLAELSLFSEEDIWFNENMRFSGGTDSVFCGDVKAAGFPVGWVPSAHVYEIVPKERLSFAYQYARARDQINVHFHRRMKEKPISRYGLILRLPTKLVEVLILTIGLPLTRGRTLLELAKTTGWISGRVGAAFGRKSSLYTQITGN